MSFSELTAIAEETGLSFNDEFMILGGEKNGIPVAVFDNTAQHRFDIICGALLTDDVLRDVLNLAESFPKKTILGLENADGWLKIYCKGFNLMQENLPLLIEFLEKLTLLCSERKISVSELDYDKIHSLSIYAVITKNKPAPQKSAKKGEKQPLNIKDTVKGIVGGIIGLLIGVSIYVVFIMMSDIIGWIGGVTMSAAVVSMYTVFSKKLKTSDVIITAFIIFIGWLFANSFAYLFRMFLLAEKEGKAVNIFGIIDNFSYYASHYFEATNMFSNSLIVSFVFIFAGAIGSYIFYYKHHSHDMY